MEKPIGDRYPIASNVVSVPELNRLVKDALEGIKMRMVMLCVLCWAMSMTSESRLEAEERTSQVAELCYDVKLRLPAGLKLHKTIGGMAGIDISPGNALAFVAVSAVASAEAHSSSSATYMLADLKSGTLAPIGELSSAIGQSQVTRMVLSSKRKLLLITVSDAQKGAVIYTIVLPEGKPRKVAEGMVSATWAGGKVAVSGLNANMSSGQVRASKIRLVDPATGKTYELPLRAGVWAGLADGTFLV